MKVDLEKDEATPIAASDGALRMETARLGAAVAEPHRCRCLESPEFEARVLKVVRDAQRRNVRLR